MQIIPVIDLLASTVVHAQQGLRDTYQPIQTPLCEGADPRDVSKALIEKVQADILYIADLDAITRHDHRRNRDTILQIVHDSPSLHIWLDAGFTSKTQLDDWFAIENIHPVLGTEMHDQWTDLLSLIRHTKGHCVLSIDYRDDVLLGPIDLIDQRHAWPQHCIVMTLDKVGADLGPDFARLKYLDQLCRERKLKKHFYAAGGVRDQNDLQLLETQGVAGALVASAIHKDRI